MKILAVDTASESCSVAITHGDKLIAEMTMVSGQTHSKHLLGMIDHALANMAGMGVDEIDGFAVTRGPGSFTGLRIGISVIKGLAASMDKPSVGISSLQALAAQAVLPGVDTICPMLDARRGEVYAGVYNIKDNVLTGGDEVVADPSSVIEAMDGPCLFMGTGAVVYADLIKEKMGTDGFFAPTCFNSTRPGIVAFLARDRFLEQGSGGKDAFMPSYLRRSDAEINYDKKV